MQRRLLPLLACPTCAHAPLTLDTQDVGEEIRQGTLNCLRCGRQCPIQDGILDVIGAAPVPWSAAQLTNYAPPAAWGYERLWRWQALTLLTGEHFPWQRELRLVRALLAPERDGLLIDVACSAGLYARSWALAAPANALIVGIDHSGAMLREAQHRAQDTHRPISFIRAAAQALPFRAGVAAGVGIGGSLNEIGDAEQALREIKRVLAPDGRFVTMNLVQARSRWGKALQQLLAPGGVAFPTLAALNQQLAQAGLQRWAQWQWRVVTITAARN